MQVVTPFTDQGTREEYGGWYQAKGFTLTDKRHPPGITPSICEEVLTSFSESDDSLAGMIEKHHIEVRDFMILSFICDQDTMSVSQLSSALGLSRHTVIDCVSRLIKAELANAEIPNDQRASTNRVTPTGAGRILARRILGP